MGRSGNGNRVQLLSAKLLSFQYLFLGLFFITTYLTGVSQFSASDSRPRSKSLIVLETAGYPSFGAVKKFFKYYNLQKITFKRGEVNINVQADDYSLPFCFAVSVQRRNIFGSHLFYLHLLDLNHLPLEDMEIVDASLELSFQTADCFYRTGIGTLSLLDLVTQDKRVSTIGNHINRSSMFTSLTPSIHPVALLSVSPSCLSQDKIASVAKSLVYWATKLNQLSQFYSLTFSSHKGKERVVYKAN